MHLRGALVGWLIAAIAVATLTLAAQPVLAAPQSSDAKKSVQQKTTTKKKTSGASSPRTASPASNRPDPNTLPPIDEPRQPAAGQKPAATPPTANQPPVAPATQPAISALQPAADQQPATSPPDESSPISPRPAVTDGEHEPALPAAASPQDDSKRIGIGQAVVLGIVEGLTEYLPVSSTGHLILVSYWLGLAEDTGQPGVFGGRKIESCQAVNAFEIVIQLGAILAVVGLYRKRVTQMARGLVGRNPNGLRLALLLFVAFVPAAAVGLLTHNAIEEHLFGPMPVVIALAVGGALMIVVERLFWTRKLSRLHAAAQTRALTPVGAARADSTGPMVNVRTAPQATSPFTTVDAMLFWQAAAIGIAQCLSLWPGTSRSMVTILAALVVGLNMAAAAEFSFLLALPTLGAATLYSGLKHWDELMQATGIPGLLVGLIVSWIVAALAVKWFVAFLTRRGLAPFGIYRIVIALVLMLFFLG